MTTFTLSAKSLSRLYVSPDKGALRRYYGVVATSEIPEEWAQWLEVNARNYSEKGKVPKAIKSTLTNKPEWFSEYNRGLTILASRIQWDNKSNLLKIKFDNPKHHGIADGGHTLSAILDNRESSDDQTSLCNLEIFTDLDEEEIPDVVEARNTSKQVASKSLLNLDGSFKPLKKELGAKAEHISWKENEDGEIDVRELIGILTALDSTSFTGTIHPTTAYSGKEACLKRFSERPADFAKLYHIASDALEMWDAIQYWLPGHYNEKGPEPGTQGKFGRLSGVKVLNKKKAKTLPFIGKTTEYDIPTGYIYPVLSSFRSMLEEEDGKWVWGKGINPVKLIEQGIAAEIFIGSVREAINNHHNANRTGKDSQTWNSAYLRAENLYLRMQ